jgi:two-component system sensor histidine kinase/response regulator
LTAEYPLTQVTPLDINEQKSALRVLLAEDSPTNQLIAKFNLEKAGYVVEVVDDGKKAVQALEEGSFDLVLMDVFMPEMDGLEATRVIRQREKGSRRRIPIVAMTGTDTQEHRAKCLEAGMDGFVSKPVTADEFHEVLASLLPQGRPPKVQGL